MKMKMMALALATLAGTAMAQPGAFTDLGTRTTAQTFSQLVTLNAPNDIQWFRVVLPPTLNSIGYVDIWTTPTADPVPASDMTDTEIGLYDAVGNGAVATAAYNDDDAGPGLHGQLTFGSSTAPRPAVTFGTLSVGAARNGNDGNLAGGEYYLAVGRFNVTFVNSGFGVSSTYTGTQTQTMLNFEIAPPTDPYPPTGTGAASPASVVVGSNVLLTVAVTPGGNPASSSVTVTGDLSGLGGSAAQQFFDNGTNGDVTANDNVFSYSYLIPATASEGGANVGFTVTDNLARSSSGTITIGLDAAGDLPATAAVPVGTGALDSISGVFTNNDVDMYRINICDAANFSATTFGATTVDTQLFLFNVDGTGVVMNDDVPTGLPGDTTLQSTLTSALIPGAGDYFLAVSRYNIDPVDAGASLIWANTPFDTERSPDGPGAGGTVAAWTGTVTGTANYTIAFTGTCYPSNGPACGLADVGGVGGAPGADAHLDNNDFVVFIDYFFSQNPIADQGATGGAPGPDGAYDNNDFIVFIDNFFNAPASCR